MMFITYMINENKSQQKATISVEGTTAFKIFKRQKQHSNIKATRVLAHL